jgi:hypothetical protein
MLFQYDKETKKRLVKELIREKSEGKIHRPFT